MVEKCLFSSIHSQHVTCVFIQKAVHESQSQWCLQCPASESRSIHVQFQMRLWRRFTVFQEKSPREWSELFPTLLWTLWTTHTLSCKHTHAYIQYSSNKALRFHSSLASHKCFMHFKLPHSSPRATSASLFPPPSPHSSLLLLALYAKVMCQLSSRPIRRPCCMSAGLPVTKLVNSLLRVMM